MNRLCSFNQIPFCFKIILTTYLIFSVSLMINTKYSISLINNPYFTFNHLHLWRLLSANFLSQSALDCLLQIFLIYTVLSALEIKISTPVMIFDYIITNIIIQTTFCITAQIIYLVDSSTIDKIYTRGVLPIFFYYLTRACNADPQTNASFFCCIIKKKYLPIVLLLSISIITLGLKLDITIAYFLSLIQYRWFDGCFIKMNRSFYLAFQKYLLCCLYGRKDFYEIQKCPGAKFFLRRSEINGNYDLQQFYQYLYVGGASQNENLEQGSSNINNNENDNSIQVQVGNMISEQNSRQNVENNVENNLYYSGQSEIREQNKKIDFEDETIQQGREQKKQEQRLQVGYELSSVNNQSKQILVQQKQSGLKIGSNVEQTKKFGLKQLREHWSKIDEQKYNK